MCVGVPSCSVGGLETCIETVEESNFVNVTQQVNVTLCVCGGGGGGWGGGGSAFGGCGWGVYCVFLLLGIYSRVYLYLHHAGCCTKQDTVCVPQLSRAWRCRHLKLNRTE